MKPSKGLTRPAVKPAKLMAPAQKKAEAATQAAATQKKVRADREAGSLSGFKE